MNQSAPAIQKRSPRPLGPPKWTRQSFNILSKFAPSLASLLGEHLFLRPRRFAPPIHEQQWLAGSKQSWLPFGTQRIARYSWGAPGLPEVVLMHGWEGRGSQLGAFVEPLLAAGYRVVSVDAPAHGRSGGRSSSLPAFTEALWALQRAGHRPHAVIAHSMGAVATAQAVAEGFDVGSLVFIGAPSHLDDIPQQFATLLGLNHTATTQLRERLSSRFGKDWRDWQVATLGQTSPRSLLVIHDEQDTDVGFEHANTFGKMWPQSRVYATKGLGHRRVLRDPKVIRAAIDFLAGRRDT